MAIPSSIKQYLASKGTAYTVVTHPTAFTAQEEAAVAHVPGREWAKVVVCLADEKPILAVLPAPSSVDFNRLKDLVRARAIRLATEDELGPLYPDCERGSMPPFGPLYGQRVFVDRALTRDPVIVFNAGTHVEAIRMTYEDFAKVAEPVVGDFANAPAR
jgi:Ala-tRNA(Pro) deacylase